MHCSLLLVLKTNIFAENLTADDIFFSRLGGPDPLDYISMYDHPGIPELHIPPHWHYIRYSSSLSVVNSY